MRLLSDAELAQILDKEIFHKISAAADSLGVECYVVGGYVRDLFLERPSNDIDVVVVGSGIEVADALRKSLGKKAHISVFRNFGTAQVKFKDLEVEFVGARKESYTRGSRKPIVEDGTLEDDQNRRDFTINAMAICLNKDRFGELVDPFDGIYDLEDGIIRDVRIEGGCSGNLQGISVLLVGMPVKEAIAKMEGIHCGYKSTSCPDQLAQALKKCI